MIESLNKSKKCLTARNLSKTTLADTETFVEVSKTNS